ncbi:hypothetical protein [Fischerella thermalis]|uniref:hypothetical protein n=1 Tax=Fischerella thermalis TaxID=372787 RepID=UPI0015E141BE|nr:hypothetical protein [Fischerella thermalis]
MPFTFYNIELEGEEVAIANLFRCEITIEFVANCWRTTQPTLQNHSSYCKLL